MTKRKCLACGKEYDFCPRCEAAKETPWMITFDRNECKEIFNVVSGYNMGISTLNDVKTVLDKYNIADVSVYQGNVKDVLMQAQDVKNNVDIELETKKEQIAPKSKGISK